MASVETTTQPWNTTETLKDAAVQGHEQINRVAEKASSKTPTLLFTYAALASIAVSAYMQIRGKRDWSLFVGQWVPSFLLFGLYNKILKTQGAD